VKMICFLSYVYMIKKTLVEITVKFHSLPRSLFCLMIANMPSRRTVVGDGSHGKKFASHDERNLPSFCFFCAVFFH